MTKTLVVGVFYFLLATTVPTMKYSVALQMNLDSFCWVVKGLKIWFCFDIIVNVINWEKGENLYCCEHLSSLVSACCCFVVCVTFFWFENREKCQHNNNPNYQRGMGSKGKLDMVRRWSRIKKSTSDDKAKYVYPLVATVAVVAVSFYLWKTYSTKSKKK